MSVAGVANKIGRALLLLEGVSAQPHRFGGTEYLLGTREIGHIHGDHLVDIPLPTKIRDEVVGAGQAQPHHILPDNGWVSIYLREARDVERAIELIHQAYQQVKRASLGSMLEIYKKSHWKSASG